MPNPRQPSASGHGGMGRVGFGAAAEEDATSATPAMRPRRRGLLALSSRLLGVAALILPLAATVPHAAAAPAAAQEKEQAPSPHHPVVEEEAGAAQSQPGSAHRDLNSLRDLPNPYGRYRPGWLTATYEQGYGQAPSLPTWVDPAQAGLTRPGWTK